ncbi:hypothetical protein GCM10011396_51890 [Undibacterium terreum]|uniref:Uncharacterized protein n=1 Tax=Undibacterium terreum TaxID=1224302 RepID=A0A916V1Y0_9BURK|nr:hypothetical protein GCM10011396_51890 [Undibacterium terreum]
MELLKVGESPWGNVETTTEWDYRNGITDVLVRTNQGHLVAFEAKLTDWRRATHQAYKNTTFTRSAYVVMPPSAAQRASTHPEIFQRYRIGLCSIDNNGVKIVIEAPDLEDEPLIPWMHRKAHLFFDEAAECGLTIANGHRNGNMQTA